MLLSENTHRPYPCLCRHMQQMKELICGGEKEAPKVHPLSKADGFVCFHYSLKNIK